MTSTSTYAPQRRTHLEALAGQLPERGLVGRMLGGDDPVLWVWHPHTGHQTIVFAAPTIEGWLFLWSPDGQESAEDLEKTADAVTKLLSRTR
ncbi:hypothetical protein [Microtetraspora sp. NBRC 16547]|uniref:hypothetical protein n=1 Tax=Microtetraspora sp. NBRC 16547 TaxID=3030993 RepID=UPI0024A05AA3|nr:hypothetical protein [Microtetraspora sp. NBRC 16547]GLW97967.1 hypothetical protein Misp02_20540 [Microtetraspora sp. NBRC 16547]